MINFKIGSKDKETITDIKSNNYSLTFIVSYKKRNEEEVCSMRLTATDLDANLDYKWINEQISLESHIVIDLIDTTNDEGSKPLEIHKENEDFLINQKLATYWHLKRELEVNGLI